MKANGSCILETERLVNISFIATQSSLSIRDKERRERKEKKRKAPDCDSEYKTSLGMNWPHWFEYFYPTSFAERTTIKRYISDFLW